LQPGYQIANYIVRDIFAQAVVTWSGDDQRSPHDLKTGTLVSFRVLAEEVLNAPADDAEFGLRVQLKFVAEDEDEGDEDDVAEDTAEWGSFGFMFVLGVLSFAEAKPRNVSVLDY